MADVVASGLVPVADWKLNEEDVDRAVVEGVGMGVVAGIAVDEINEDGAEDALEEAAVAGGIPVTGDTNEKA